MLVRLISKRWVQIFLLLLLLAAAVGLRLQNPPAIERLRQLTFDYYNKLMPRVPTGEVLIVDIDEESIKIFGQWPWPRTVVADIPVILREMGAKAVAFDIVFSEVDRTSPARIAANLPQTEDMQAAEEILKKLPDNDQVFAEKIAQAGKVITGFVWANQETDKTPLAKTKFFNLGTGANPGKFVHGSQNFTVTLPVLTEAAAGNGSFSMLPENDGIVRRVPLLTGLKDEKGAVQSIYPALSLEAVRVAEEKQVIKITSYSEPGPQGFGIKNVIVGDHTVPTDERGNIWVYYSGHRKDIYIPAWKVLSRQLDPAMVKDKIVFIGTSAIGLLDLRSSPLNPVVPGVEMHAEITEQILSGKYLFRPDILNGIELVSTVAISLFIIFLAPFIGTAWLALLGGLLISGGGAGALYAYQHFGYLLDPVYPTLAILTIFIMSSILTNLRTEMDRRAVRNAFGHYISPALMEELTKDPDRLKLGGEVRELSVMFTDIRNFTTISESMDPAELIKMMNDFLTPMTSCVLDNRGTVDKYMGDAMMAFWNAPLDDPDHARHACKSALEMLKALGPVNDNLKAKAEQQGRAFHPLKAGIGIHSGRASVGNMGSKQRFAYSALGDTVNLASRIEGQTKGYGVSVMMTEAVRRAVPDYAVLELDLLTVKGRTEPERVYALLGDAAYAATEVFKSFSGLHTKMLESYRTLKLDNAERLAEECARMMPDLAGLYKLYLERIVLFRKNPPEAGWRGVWVAKEK